MLSRLVICLLLGVLSACSFTRSSSPVIVQHDLGGILPLNTLQPKTPLRSINVSALPTVSTVVMQYRQAHEPSRRSAYAFNRWAANPAVLMESGLSRLINLSGTGQCRMQMVLAEFIVETESAANSGPGRALIAVEMRLYNGNTVVAHRDTDVSRPMPVVSPSKAALALREVLIELGGRATSWLDGPDGAACRG